MSNDIEALKVPVGFESLQYCNLNSNRHMKEH